LEWTGNFKRIDRRRGHMQAVKHPDGGSALLLFQDSKIGRFFAGEIWVMDYGSSGKLTRKEPLTGLEKARFYTLAPFDLNKDGKPEWVGLGEPGLDELSRLHVWDQKGEVLWKGEKKLGGTNNAITVGNAPPGDLPPRTFFNSRVVVTDIDGDGKKEILAVKNVPLIDHVQNFKVFVKGNLTAYSIEGTSLVPAWKTRNMKYCLIDMQAEGGTLFLAAQKGKIEKITQGSSRIMWFE